MTKRLLLAALVLFAPFFALADGGCVNDMALQQRTSSLAVIPNASVRVCTNANCTSLATIYEDETLAVSVANPLTADARGNFAFCAAGGKYWVKVTNPADNVSYTMPNFTVPTAADLTAPGTIGGTTPGAGHFTSLSATDDVFATGNPYFFAPSSGWRKGLERKATNSRYISTSPAPVPNNIVYIGDSIAALSTRSFRNAVASYDGLNALGFTPFYANDHGSDMTTFTVGAGCTSVRGDTSSPQAWGPAGSYVECPSGQSITVLPGTQFRFDKFRVWYRKYVGGGTFTWNVDAAGATTIDTNAAEALGVLDQLISTTAHDATHSIVLSVTAGTVRFYGIDTYQRAQAGAAIHYFQSGGTQLHDWAQQPTYIASAIATLAPSTVVIELGINDAATSGRTAATFATDLTSFITSLNLPATTNLIVETHGPRGTQFSPPIDDSATKTLLDQYRTKIFQLAPTLDFSIFDARRLFGTDYVASVNNGMMSDIVHPSEAGAAFKAFAWASALFHFPGYTGGQNTTFESIWNKSLLMASPSGCYGFANFQSSGGISDAQSGLCPYTATPNTPFPKMTVAGVDRMWWAVSPAGNAATTAITSAGVPKAYQWTRQNGTTQAGFISTDVSSNSIIDTNNGDVIVMRNGTERIRATSTGATLTGAIALTGAVTGPTSISTATNCSSSGGTCVAAPAGSVSIAAAATTVTVATTAVTANSQIFIQEDSSLGTKLSVTCNTTISRTYAVTTRTAGTSFVITSSAAPAANPACLSYYIVN